MFGQGNRRKWYTLVWHTVLFKTIHTSTTNTICWNSIRMILAQSRLSPLVILSGPDWPKTSTFLCLIRYSAILNLPSSKASRSGVLPSCLKHWHLLIKDQSTKYQIIIKSNQYQIIIKLKYLTVLLHYLTCFDKMSDHSDIIHFYGQHQRRPLFMIG